MFAFLFFFFLQFPPADPPMCLHSPQPPAASWCAGLKFLSLTEMVSFWATRSVCAFYVFMVLFSFFAYLLLIYQAVKGTSN